MGTDARELAPFVDCIPWPTLIVDATGRITAFNDAIMESQCVKPECGSSLCETLPHVCDALEGDPPWSGGQDVEVKRISGGTCHHDRVITRALPDGSVALFIVDTSAGPAGENERAQTERLASLGFMAASICHELNNPLTSIRSLVQTLETDHSRLSSDAVEKSLALVSSNVDRVLTISRKLTEFSRMGSSHRHPIRVDEPIEAALALTRHRSECSDIEFVHSADSSVQVRGNADQLQQVFQNILVNCAQAIDGAGTIRVETGRRDGRFAQVVISDTGPGIDPDKIDRLFEPFYTTKAGDGGTGLGLAISNEIVHEHEGRIRVETAAGSGTSFFIELPLCPRD